MLKLSENKTFMFLLRACVALLIICLVFNLCVIPSFAIDINNSFPVSPDVPYLASYSYDNSLHLGTDTGVNPIAVYDIYYNSNTSVPDDVYMFIFNGNLYFAYGYNSYQFGLVFHQGYSNGAGSSISTSAYGQPYSRFNLNSDYNICYYAPYPYSVSSYPTFSYDFPVYDTLEAGLSAVRDYIDNGGFAPLPAGSDGDVVIPAGWVSYIQVSGGNMLLETTFPEYSNIIGVPAWNSRSTISYGVSSLPVEGTVFSETSGTLINWAKSSQGKNILGQTKQAGYGVNNLEQSQNYIVIYNPANRQVSERGQGDISPTITAHFTELIEAKSYPLTQTFNIGTGETTSTSVSGFDNPLTTTPEGTIDNQGNPSTPNIGGSGADASYNDWSVTNYLQSIKETLDNFASNFMGLLQSPISHVRQLIAAGSDYFQVIQGLYAWLPSPVQTTIESALIVSISIGVIGLLL